MGQESPVQLMVSSSLPLGWIDCPSIRPKCCCRDGRSSAGFADDEVMERFASHDLGTISVAVVVVLWDLLSRRMALAQVIFDAVVARLKVASRF